MICDHTAQIDIRTLPQKARPIPEVVHFEGERLVTTWTCTAFGGQRQWWLCPSCDRRCAILYRRGAGPLWGCRVCMGGRYASEHKSVEDRMIHKAVKIREKLGQIKGGIVAPFPQKPKAMHWKTYLRLRAQAQEIENRVAAADMEWLKRFKKSAL